MKKALLLSICLASIVALSGCGKSNLVSIEDRLVPIKDRLVPIEDVSKENTIRLTTGRYHINGQVVTADGNLWDYSQETISDKPSYDNEPVIVGLADNGTPNAITDDEIVFLVLDRETEIYDTLEERLSEIADVTRDNNTIYIDVNN